MEDVFCSAAFQHFSLSLLIKCVDFYNSFGNDPTQEKMYKTLLVEDSAEFRAFRYPLLLAFYYEIPELMLHEQRRKTVLQLSYHGIAFSNRSSLSQN